MGKDFTKVGLEQMLAFRGCWRELSISESEGVLFLCYRSDRAQADTYDEAESTINRFIRLGRLSQP